MHNVLRLYLKVKTGCVGFIYNDVPVLEGGELKQNNRTGIWLHLVSRAAQLIEL